MTWQLLKRDVSTTGVDRVRNTNGSLIIVNVSLKRCIGLAYGFEDGGDYLLSGPDWIDSERFDISAKYPPEASRDDFLLMFQRLLSERLGLRVHHELRTFTVVVAKGGATLRPAATPGAYRFSLQNGHVMGASISMPMLADRLSRADMGPGRRVVDMTGLVGAFDLELNWSPDEPAGAAGPSLFTALQEQLGLKLEFRKNVPLDVLVVDHADKEPSGN